MFKILIAEPDLELCALLAHTLKQHGYATVCASNGKAALDALGNGYVDLLLCESALPTMSGCDLARVLRKNGNMIPILMISDKRTLEDMRTDYAAGADDYMVKPIDMDQMALRVGALLRRWQMINGRRLQLGDTVMDCDSLTIRRENKIRILPQKEFMLLYKMAGHPGKIYTRQQLMDEIWGYSSSSDTHTVDVHICRLRERFHDNPDFKIVTIRGVGYKVVKA
ncbi:MAG: response regulator transcription factor [Clostridia bacterium]|nr:response regulator transcription factor [Clostridia bacterium]